MTRLFATALAFLLATTALAAADDGDPYAVGKRTGPFVVSDKSLSDLLGEGYEIRGNLGTALVLEKGASVYSCSIPPDPEHLSYRTYFVCSELKETPRQPTAKTLKPGQPGH